MIAIVSNWFEPGALGFDRLASITMPNRRAYARRHGYLTGEFGFPGHYGKIEALLAAWNSADWLWWLDVDAIILRPEVRLQALTACAEVTGSDVLFCCDDNGLNSGSMLLRTVPSVRRVLTDAIRLRLNFDRAPWHDQNAFAYLLWAIRERCQVVERSRLNSYPSDLTPESFVLHCPGMPNQQRFELLFAHLIRIGENPASYQGTLKC